MCVCVCFIAYVIHLRAGIEGLLHSFHYASTQLIDQERMRPALVFIQCFDAVGWNLDGRKGVQSVKTSAIYPQLLSFRTNGGRMSGQPWDLLGKSPVKGYVSVL